MGEELRRVADGLDPVGFDHEGAITIDAEVRVHGDHQAVVEEQYLGAAGGHLVGHRSSAGAKPTIGVRS